MTETRSQNFTAIHRPLLLRCCSIHVTTCKVQPCCLDVVLYVLNCGFGRNIPLEIEFKSRGSDRNVQLYHPSAVRRLSTRENKKQDACRGVHSACRREVNRHKLDICCYGSGRGGSRHFCMQVKISWS